MRSEDALLVHARDVGTIHSNEQTLVLLSKDDGSSAYRSIVNKHIVDPNTILAVLPDALVSYRKAVKSLWIERTILKWMKDVKVTSERRMLPLQSRL
jgi:hypothetical protein